jgi:hypothetical protein
MTDDELVEAIVAKITAKHEEMVKKHKARITKMRKSGDLSKLGTPLWMQTWEQPVLMYRNDAHLTLEDVVDLTIRAVREQ